MKLPGGRDPSKDIEYSSSARREEEGRLAAEDSGVVGYTAAEADILMGRAPGFGENPGMTGTDTGGPDIIYYTQEERASAPPEPVVVSASSEAPPTRGRTVTERGCLLYTSDAADE